MVVCVFPVDPAFAVQEPLHVRQKRDELAVMPDLKLLTRRTELVEHFAPRIARSRAIEEFPVLLHLRVGPDRHQLQWPHQDLPEVPHGRGRARRLLRHHRLPRCVPSVDRCVEEALHFEPTDD